MKSRFTNREAVALYLVVLTLAVGLYVLGLSLGRAAHSAGEPPGVVERRPVRESPEPPPSARSVESVVATTLPPSPDVTAAVDREPLEEVVVEETPIPEVIDPPPVSAPPPAIAPAAPPKGDRYTVQVAALSTLREAEQALMRLEGNRFQARVQSPTAALGDRFYRVWVGEFESIEEARDLENRLKAAGFLTYIRKVE